MKSQNGVKRSWDERLLSVRARSSAHCACDCPHVCLSCLFYVLHSDYPVLAVRDYPVSLRACSLTIPLSLYRSLNHPILWGIRRKRQWLPSHRRLAWALLRPPAVCLRTCPRALPFHPCHPRHPLLRHHSHLLPHQRMRRVPRSLTTQRPEKVQLTKSPVTMRPRTRSPLTQRR